MSSQRVQPSLPIAIPQSDDDNIIVRWKEGIVNSSMDEKLSAKSKSIGLQHAMDILGESTSSESKSTLHLSIGERATDGTSSAALPLSIDPGDITEPTQPHPQEWSNHSTSELTSPMKTPSTNNQNDQQSVKMILPPS